MKIQGALIKEQGVTFAIGIVKPSVLQYSNECESARDSFRSFFPNVPIVLMAQDGRGRATYQGRKDIVNFLVRIPLRAIPWKEYTLN